MSSLVYNVILNTLRVFKCLTMSFRMNDIAVQYTQHSCAVAELSNSILARIIRKNCCAVLELSNSIFVGMIRKIRSGSLSSYGDALLLRGVSV